MNEWSTQEIVIPNRRDSPENLRQENRHRTDDSRATYISLSFSKSYKIRKTYKAVFWLKT